MHVWTASLESVGEALPDPCVELAADERDERTRSRWRGSDLNAPPGFAAAPAAEGQDWTILRFDATLLPR